MVFCVNKYYCGCYKNWKIDRQDVSGINHKTLNLEDEVYCLGTFKHHRLWFLKKSWFRLKYIEYETSVLYAEKYSQRNPAGLDW